MSRLLLSLDSSSPCGSVALTRGTTLIAEISLNVSNQTHSDYLLRYVDFLLAESGYRLDELDALAVVVGPGSFTGLRVGIATVQGLALSANLPVYPVSSLQALAFANGETTLPVCALLDARKKEVYAARYRWVDGLPELVGAEHVLPPQQLAKEINEQTVFVGNGTQLYAEVLEQQFKEQAVLCCQLNTVPRAAAVGILVARLAQKLTAVDPYHLTPVYIRPSDAELQAKR